MSMRRAVARPAGSSDLMDEVRAYESSDSLSDAQKVALRLHDAFLFHPGQVSAALRAEALAHFSAPQLVELALKFYFWSSNRPTVALGKLAGDAPHDPNRLTPFHYDDEGRYIVHSNA
jgi:alkylhydroperoxidase family enzyme